MNCPYDYDDPEFRLEWFEDRLEKVELERDSLEAKVWELERMLNEQEDVNREWFKKRFKKLDNVHNCQCEECIKQRAKFEQGSKEIEETDKLTGLDIVVEKYKD